MRTVSVDTTKCNGSANCALICPEVFELDEDRGKSMVVQQEPPEELITWVQQAVDSCPTKALSLSGGD